MAGWSLIIILVVTLAGLYYGVKLLTWGVITAAILLVASLSGMLDGAPRIIYWAVFMILMVTFNIASIRKNLITQRIFNFLKKSTPKLSKTEEIALNAGDTWVEESLFRGKPNWSNLHEIPKHELTEEEQKFLDNETEELCRLIDDWQVMNSHDLPENVWQFMKDKGFFGLVIDKQYGGKGFSAKAHSDIVFKVASRSGVGAVTVMVPNSLGPGELLYHYGTEKQKNYYLPRLAKGEDIPCFALTEPQAGSDATSLQSTAIVCKGVINGKETLGLKLNFNKRYITLAPVATLIGLAVDLKDPNGLLGDKGAEGITCVLMPRSQQGLEIGNRHLPAYLPFMNGTVRGKDVFVPINYIIGGQKMAGEGWRMLVECLSIGRSISLPALGTASAAVSYFTSSAYAHIRKQFGLEIGKFEGIEETLGSIGGLSYLTQATRQMTVAAVDSGIKPSVASAIAKYHNTENGRKCVSDGMDLHGGRAIIAGPSNYFIGAYLGIPVSITVEGANIMTRNLLIFGQGSMACHPYVRDEFYAISEDNLSKFDELVWTHVGYYAQNKTRALLSSLSAGLFIQAPNYYFKSYYKKVTRLSYAFAWVADLSLMYLGGALKRKERLSARLGDVLSHLYMASAVLKYFKDNNESADDVVYARWALDYSLYQAQEALIELGHNFPSKTIGWFIRKVCFPYGRSYRMPSDKLSHKLTQSAMKNDGYRQRVAKQLALIGGDNSPLDKVNDAFMKLLAAQPVYQKLMDAVKAGKIKKGPIDKMLLQANTTGTLTQKEIDQIQASETARLSASEVDEFSFDYFSNEKPQTSNVKVKLKPELSVKKTEETKVQ
ncbi:acyl-CoA dehydrogenase [Thiotrichales bacterium 19S9-12]|nr:acyl-CoA dehydrogenase [Thiotrichales bacterium 19S9-11]MCF6811908.1 acyl-CoA dehydrogenase [Thiotrichales bacterium 19S9-12]